MTRPMCRCGHSRSDHDGECMYGWSGDPDEVECDCLAFVLDYELVESRAEMDLPA